MSWRVKNWKDFQHFKDRKPPWIKLYRDLLDDPDWHELDGDDAKSLVMLWLIASEDSGNLPDIRKISFRLRITQTRTEQLLNRLSHWLEHDDVNAISERHHVDAPETEEETETEREEEEETDIRAVANATRPAVDEKFEEFWASYPKRGEAANPKKPARDKFHRAVKAGADPDAIIAAARRYAQIENDAGRIGTEKIAQAMTWLNQQRWGDYEACGPPRLVPDEPPRPPSEDLPSHEELERKYA